MTRLLAVILAFVAAAAPAAAASGRDRLSPAAAERVAERALQTPRETYRCAAIVTFEDFRAALGRPYDARFAVEFANGNLRALHCEADRAASHGRIPRPRLVLLDARTHGVINAWTYSPWRDRLARVAESAGRASGYPN